MQARQDLPEGRVTFLFTDVEGSTQLLERHPAEYGRLIARHHELLEEAVERRGGVVFETIGDAVYAAFAEPVAGVEAAADAQRALLREDWGPLEQIKVRMGLHTGPVERRGAHYFGPALYRCARLMATAHGGQVVLSEATATLADGALEAGAALVDLGQHRLKDLKEPERVYQLRRPELPAEFPPLRSAGGRPNNLPSDVKTFVGRQDELTSVRDVLLAPDVRVLTLTGAGGSGKTRLALRAAKSLLEPFRDGVFLVDLAPLADPQLVVPAAAEVLRSSADRRPQPPRQPRHAPGGEGAAARLRQLRARAPGSARDRGAGRLRSRPPRAHDDPCPAADPGRARAPGFAAAAPRVRTRSSTPSSARPPFSSSRSVRGRSAATSR